MKLIFIGLAVNLVTAVLVSMSHADIGIFALITCGISFVGCLFLLCAPAKLGLYIILASSALLVPIGMIACFGVLKELSKIKDDAFQAEFEQKIKLKMENE